MNLVDVAINQELAMAALSDAPEGTLAVIADEGVSVFSNSEEVLEQAALNIEQADEKINEQLKEDPVGTIANLLSIE